MKRAIYIAGIVVSLAIAVLIILKPELQSPEYKRGYIIDITSNDLAKKLFSRHTEILFLTVQEQVRQDKSWHIARLMCPLSKNSVSGTYAIGDPCLIIGHSVYRKDRVSFKGEYILYGAGDCYFTPSATDKGGSFTSLVLNLKRVHVKRTSMPEMHILNDKHVPIIIKGECSIQSDVTNEVLITFDRYLENFRLYDKLNIIPNRKKQEIE